MQKLYPTRLKLRVNWQEPGVAITTAAFWLFLCCSSIALASKQSKPNEFPFNPLERNIPDLLLPQSLKKQPLSALERRNLEAALDELDAQAQARWNAGDSIAAFDIWNRELRLRQALAPLAEVEALERIGAIAWSQGKSKEVQFVTQRLQTIQQQINTQPGDHLALLQALGEAFQQLRSPQHAVQVYQQILAIQQQQKQDVAFQEQTLNTIAELHLSWFDYSSAAATYQKLLSLARKQGDRISEETYLKQLAYIYEQANQPALAVEIEQQLAEFYLNEQDIKQLPTLRLQIASNYAALGQLEKAFQNYKEAYASAWSLQQYYLAAEALQKLIALYRSQGQTKAALEASQILLQADERANDDYGIMNAYDQIGQIYLQLGEYPEAKAAFQNGLEIAKQLQYQEKYFTQQIAQASQRISK